MKFNAFIVEDTQNDYSNLETILNTIPTITVISEYLDNYPYKEAARRIKELQPNLLIIDHELNEPGKNGPSLYYEVGNQYNFTIFCSGHPIVASDDGSIDINTTYVNKSLDKGTIKKNLLMAIGKAQTYFTNFQKAHRFEIKIDGNTEFFNYDDMVYFEGQGRHTHLYLKNKHKPILIKRMLGEIMGEYDLSFMGFVHVHKSYFVNKYKIVSIKPKSTFFKKKGIDVELSSGEISTVKVSDSFIKSEVGKQLIETRKKK